MFAKEYFQSKFKSGYRFEGSEHLLVYFTLSLGKQQHGATTTRRLLTKKISNSNNKGQIGQNSISVKMY